jgi:hypothetical protein
VRARIRVPPWRAVPLLESLNLRNQAAQLFRRQERIVHGVLACAVLAAQVRWVVQPVRSCRAKYWQAE